MLPVTQPAILQCQGPRQELLSRRALTAMPTSLDNPQVACARKEEVCDRPSVLPEGQVEQQAPGQAGAAQPGSSGSSAGPSIPHGGSSTGSNRRQQLQRMYVGQLPEGSCLFPGSSPHVAGGGACSSSSTGGGIGSEWSDIALHGALPEQGAHVSGSGADVSRSREALQLQRGGPQGPSRRRWWRMGDVAYLGSGVYLWGAPARKHSLFNHAHGRIKCRCDVLELSMLAHAMQVRRGIPGIESRCTGLPLLRPALRACGRSCCWGCNFAVAFECFILLLYCSIADGVHCGGLSHSDNYLDMIDAFAVLPQCVEAGNLFGLMGCQVRLACCTLERHLQIGTTRQCKGCELLPAQSTWCHVETCAASLPHATRSVSRCLADDLLVVAACGVCVSSYYIMWTQ